MAGIFNVDWRTLFSQAQPPKKRNSQTIDLGESLLATIVIDGAALNSFDDNYQLEKKYNCTKIVMEASLDEKFGQSTFWVETAKTIVRALYWWREDELEPIYLQSEASDRPYYLFTESEPIAEAAIIVHVPSALFISSLDKVDTEVKKLKVAGKSYKLVSL